MKTWKYIFVAVCGMLITSAFIISCKKGTTIRAYTVNATINDAGSVAADGCGWQLLADSTYYPLNLDDKFKVNGLKVNVTYHKANARFYCGMILFTTAQIAPPGTPEIVIDRMVTR